MLAVGAIAKPRGARRHGVEESHREARGYRIGRDWSFDVQTRIRGGGGRIIAEGLRTWRPTRGSIDSNHSRRVVAVGLFFEICDGFISTLSWDL